jgi:hypothetical protein
MPVNRCSLKTTFNLRPFLKSSLGNLVYVKIIVFSRLKLHRKDWKHREKQKLKLEIVLQYVIVKFYYTVKNLDAYWNIYVFIYIYVFF